MLILLAIVIFIGLLGVSLVINFNSWGVIAASVITASALGLTYSALGSFANGRSGPFVKPFLVSLVICAGVFTIIFFIKKVSGFHVTSKIPGIITLALVAIIFVPIATKLTKKDLKGFWEEAKFLMIDGVKELRSPSIEKFELSGAPSAPKKYPVYVKTAFFGLKDGGQLPIPGGFIGGGWGEAQSLIVLGQTRFATPTKLKVEWYDFVANKGYGGTFDLSEEELTSFLRESLPASDKTDSSRSTYLIVGFAPGGDVALWVQPHRARRLFTMLKAHPTNLEAKSLSNDKTLSSEQFVEKMLSSLLAAEDLKEVKSKPVPEGLWSKYNQRFNWQPLVFVDKGDLLDIEFANGEIDWFDLSNQRQPESSRNSKSLPIPRELGIRWSEGGETRSAVLSFDPEQLIKIFETASKENPGIEMSLEVGPKVKLGVEIRTRLRAGEKTYGL